MLSGGGAYLAVRTQIRSARADAQVAAARSEVASVIGHGAALQMLAQTRAYIIAHPYRTSWAGFDASGLLTATATHSAELVRAAKQVRYLGNPPLLDACKALTALIVSEPTDPKSAEAWAAWADQIGEAVVKLDDLLDATEPGGGVDD